MEMDRQSEISQGSLEDVFITNETFLVNSSINGPDSISTLKVLHLLNYSFSMLCLECVCILQGW